MDGLPATIAGGGVWELAAPWAVPFVAVLVVSCSAVDSNNPPPRGGAGQLCAVTFGAVVSLSGEHASQGQAMRDGYEAFRRSINRTGGINVGGKRCLVELIYADDGSDAAEQLVAIEALATKVAAVDFLLDGWPESTDQSFLVTEAFGIPILGGASRLSVGSLAGLCTGATGAPSAATVDADPCTRGPAASAAGQLHAYQLAIEAVGSIDARSVADDLTKLATEQP